MTASIGLRVNAQSVVRCGIDCSSFGIVLVTLYGVEGDLRKLSCTYR